MRVLYDHREERSTIPALLELAGIELEATQLPVADYVVSDRVALERKRASDLIASIVDGRLFDQAGRLREAYECPLLIIEGTPEQFPEEGWKGALASVMRAGVGVLRCADDAEVAEWIARLARQEARGPSGPRGAARKAKEPDRLAEQVLSNLPGISVRGAQRLLERFGTLAGVFAATEKELREVEGIGRKRSRDLAALFARRWGEDPFAPSSG